MASVTIKKYTMQATVTRQIGHAYREHQNYSNHDIDTASSGENIVYGTADGCRQKLRDTLAEVDARKPPKRKKADRKTVIELGVPAPRENMDATAEIAFFDALLQELKAKGEMHVCGAVIHADEKHFYPDKGAVHESRTHMHIFAIPENDRGCNMKSWLTPDRYNKVNALADKACREVLGYDFRDGSKQKSRGTVEELKTKAAVEAVALAEAAQKTADVALAQAQEAERRADRAIELRETVRADSAEMQARACRNAVETRQEAQKAAQEDADKILQAARKEAAQARRETAAARRELQELQKRADKIRKSDPYQDLYKDYRDQKHQIISQVKQIMELRAEADAAFDRGKEFVFNYMTDDEQKAVEARYHYQRHHSHSR